MLLRLMRSSLNAFDILLGLWKDGGREVKSIFSPTDLECSSVIKLSKGVPFSGPAKLKNGHPSYCRRKCSSLLQRYPHVDFGVQKNFQFRTTRDKKKEID